MNKIAAMQARSGTVRGAPPGVGRRRWQQRLDALPQGVGQELVGQGGHKRGSFQPSVQMPAIRGPVQRDLSGQGHLRR
jgi:hypothetical protein